MNTPNLDWASYEQEAAALTTRQIEERIVAIREALPSADELDRATGETRGGLYRDQLSVLHKELKARAKRPSCQLCGR